MYASGGSACTSEDALPSHVLAAIGVPVEFLHGSLRLTLAHTHTEADVRTALVPAVRRVVVAALTAGGYLR